jgi:hypothetical protein
MAKRRSVDNPRFRNYVRRQPVETPYSTTIDDHLIYGEQDNFPLKLSKLVYDSPAASSCISVVHDFIEGSGFSDDDFSNMIVNNQGQTMAEVNHLVSESVAMYEGFALNVKYSPEGKITQLFFVPFENCRLGVPDDFGIISEIKYNPYFGTNQYKQKSTETYYAFNPDPAVVVTQMKNQGKSYKGQILYWGSTRALSRFYPQPSYYAAKNWMEVDARIGEYHKENLKNGFLQSILFKIVGNPNAPSTDPNDSVFDSDNNKQEPAKTIGEAFDEMMAEKFSGTEKANNTMVFWANNKEEFPQIEAFPSAANVQIFDTLQVLTTKNITIATKVPAILANIHEGVSLGGDGNTIQAAVKLMQQRAQKWQAVLEQQYTKIFDNWYKPIQTEIEIVDYDPFPIESTVDPVIWAELNPETKNKWIQENTSIEIVETVQPQVQVNPTNVLYNSYPDKAKANAKKALKWNEQSPGQCGTKMGWSLAQSIADGQALSYKTIKRLARYLKNNEKHMNKPFNESCDTVLFHAWGGKEMMEWSSAKIKEVEL